MLKYLGFVVLIILIGCNRKTTEISSKFKLEQNVPINILIDHDTKSDSILFLIENRFDGDILIFNYNKFILEVFENGSWRRLRILDCPCGSPCAKPADFIVLEREGEYSLKWNKTEQWCGKRNKLGITEAINISVSKGQCRIGVIYGTTPNDKRTHYKEFLINN